MTRERQRTALVTGARRGIGAAIAEELAIRGYELLTPTREEMDISNPDSIRAFVEGHVAERVDVLINNAGINFLRPIPAIDAQTCDTMMQTNLFGPLHLIQAFGPAMEKQKWGRILNVSSIFGIVTKPDRGIYSMTKAALNALTRSAAIEFGPSGVLVNALCPGYVDTELTRQNNTAEVLEALTQTIPLRRLACPSELAKAAAFLVSDDNTYLTGQTLVVDGGFTCQ